MSRQYQIPGGPMVSVPDDGTAYALPGYGFLNQAASPPVIPFNAGFFTALLNPMAWF